MISANSRKRDSARMQVRRYVMDLLWQHASEAYHLPSNKELADELGIARSTAQLELKLLIEEGYLTAKHGVGTFTVPSKMQQFRAPLIGILNGDGKTIYEPFYIVSLKSHTAAEIAKQPALIQEIRLFSERQNDLATELRSIDCNALVCFNVSAAMAQVLREIRKFRPVVTVDTEVDGIPSVELDRREKGRALGRALLAENRTKVLFIQSERYRATTFLGVRDVFAEAGHALRDECFLLNTTDGLNGLLESGFRPQAVAPSLETFEETAQILREHGIDLNEECRLATFMFKPRKMQEPVLLFDFPFEEFGRQTAELVSRLLENPDQEAEHIVFKYNHKATIV